MLIKYLHIKIKIKIGPYGIFVKYTPSRKKSISFLNDGRVPGAGQVMGFSGRILFSVDTSDSV